MTTSPIKFGTSGWRGIIADDFTFSNVRLAVAAVAEHVLSHTKNPTLLVAHDTRFFAEEFVRTAAIVLTGRGVKALICQGPTPTPVVAYEIKRRKVDGAINFTASHNPPEYNGLKFSASDGGPALPEVTKDIEKRAAELFGRPEFAVPAYPSAYDAPKTESVELKPAYLKRLDELIRFDVIRDAAKKSGARFVYDALHGCGAGYTDGALTNHGIQAHLIRANRDVLFDGSAPDVSEENLKLLAKTVVNEKALAGLATDGDADRFGIVDSDGTWISPNHILGLVYDYLVETRGWKMPAARSVATSHLVDAVARLHKLPPVHETPVGFKYIGQLIEQDAIAMGGEESAGLTIRGHVPEKDGILACLLVAEMTAARGKSVQAQLKDLFQRVGREYWPQRVNLHLTDDVKARTLERLKGDFKEFLGLRVVRTDRTDGLQLSFEDDSWVLLRPSGTEPLLRIYTESGSLEESSQIAEQARQWVFSAAAGGTK
jgi:phosphoglucomutase